MAHPVQYRRALLAILDQIDHEEALQKRVANLQSLLETLRCYRPVPQALVQIVEVFGRNCVPDPDLISKANSDLNCWLEELGLPRVDEFSAEPEPMDVIELTERCEPEKLLTPEPPVVPLLPLPNAWKDRVPAIRERLLSDPGPRLPFSRWLLPQPRWKSRWIDSFAVVAADDDDANTGFILVPSDDAAQSSEAEGCWLRRLETAEILQQGAAVSQVIRPCVHREADVSCGIALLRSDFARRTLAERVRGSNGLSPRESVELGISICGILGSLNARGIHVLDLSPEWIAFDWSEGQRFTQLLDPTAVIPGSGLLPEWRGAELGIAEASELGQPETSQVFLIGSLVLALICETVEDFLTADFPNGRSATFACLSGARNLADSHATSIAAPLVADLARKAAQFGDRIDSDALVESLRWSVAEHRDERFDSLSEFAAALRKTVR